MGTVNRMTFEGVEDTVNFIKVLHDISKSDSGWYCDIHTYYDDCNIYVVEWTQSRDWGKDGFKYVGEDEVVMIEGEFPDKHYEYFLNEEEYEEALSDWLKEHPTYDRDFYGRWYDKNDVVAIDADVECVDDDCDIPNLEEESSDAVEELTVEEIGTIKD